MPPSKLSPADLQRITELAHQWGKIVVRQHWGEQGPGLDVTLDQMEEVAIAAVRGLLAGTLEGATLQQAQALATPQPCPDCGRLCPLTTEERLVTVRGGTFCHREPKAHCPACRRDFFPAASLPAPG
jgi:hypothetical protein